VEHGYSDRICDHETLGNRERGGVTLSTANESRIRDSSQAQNDRNYRVDTFAGTRRPIHKSVTENFGMRTGDRVALNSDVYRSSTSGNFRCRWFRV